MTEPKQTRPTKAFDDTIGGIIPLKWLDVVVFVVCVGWVGLALVVTLNEGSTTPYALLKGIHNHFGRFSLAVALGMFGIASYIGLWRSADVTPYFRRGTYVVFGMMVMQALLGATMWLMGGRSGEDVHILYGFGVVLSLPFFIFVEKTAEKRPAMGSYLWGFGLLAGVIVRSISTGAWVF